MQKVGELTSAWAETLGLRPGTPVAAPIIDAHAAAPGGAVTSPGTMFMIMGISTCHILMAENEVLVEGISGVVEDGIVPGLFGYEAGQAGVGDISAWFVIEATAFGTWVIIEAFTEQGVPVDAIVTDRGLTKNALLMQIYADVTGLKWRYLGWNRPRLWGRRCWVPWLPGPRAAATILWPKR